MKAFFIAAALAALPAMASAGPIERACNASDRPAANRSLCGCIQNVADATLQRREQRQAAKFFRDPQRAQDTRQSDNKGKERFWKRYRAFTNAATRSCG